MSALEFTPEKDPNEVDFFPLAFNAAINDPITNHTVRVVTDSVPVEDSDSDLTIIQTEVIDHVVTATIGGGSAGQTYRIEYEITLTSGRVFNREAKLKVKNL